MRVTLRYVWVSILGGGPLWLGVIAACLLAGCWQEVEYTEPSKTAEAPATDSQPADGGAPATETDGGAEEFADELASTLARDPRGAESDSSPGTTLTDSASPAETPAPPGAETTADASGNDDLFGDVPLDSEPVAEPVATATTESQQPAENTDSSGMSSPDGGATASAHDPLFDEPVEPMAPESEPAAESDAFLPSDNATAPDPSQEASPPTETPATTATEDAPPAANKVARASWLLGSKLSLAALAHGKGAPGEDVQKLMDQSRTLAKLFGMTVPDLPMRAIGSATDAIPEKALDYLFAEGNQIGTELARRQGVENAALFEAAVKSNILLVLYRPGSPAVDAISTAISQAGARGKLPAELWQPLVDLLDRQAPIDEVGAGVYRMHADVDQYLAGDVTTP